MKRILVFLGFLCFCVLIAAGCSKDPLENHKMLTNVFDGVPDLPPLDQLCKDNMDDLFDGYYFDRLSEASAGAIEEEKIVKSGSSHRPYAAKDCQGCHDFQQRNLLLAPENELCEMCHVSFVQPEWMFVHGPVAVRDCLACHLPHSSQYKSLLQESVSDICSKCHHEDRLASEMHKLVMKNNMECVNCHDAHGGDTPYFLK